MATVERGQTLAALSPLVRAAAAGAAEGGGGRQHLAAAVAAVIRTGAAVLFGTEAVDPQGGDADAEVHAREQLARPFLAEQVEAGRAGVRPRPSGGAKAYRDWAQHAEFGVGAAAMPGTAREARRRGRGPRRRGRGSEEDGEGDAVGSLAPVPSFPALLGSPADSAKESAETAGPSETAGNSSERADSPEKTHSEEQGDSEVQANSDEKAASEAQSFEGIDSSEQAYAEEQADSEAKAHSDERADSEAPSFAGIGVPTIVHEDVEDGPSLPTSSLDVVGQESEEDEVKMGVVVDPVCHDAEAEEQDAHGGEFCPSAAARCKSKQQARLARRAAAAPVVGTRVEVISSFIPVRQARWVPIGVRGVVAEVCDAAQPDGLQDGDVVVVWDAPRLASVRGGGIGAAIVSPHDWRCCRRLAEGDG